MINEAMRLEHVQLGQIRAVAEKAKLLEQQGHDIIHLEIGEPDFTTPENIVQVTQDALSQGNVHYAPNRGVLDLRREIAKKLKVDNDIEVDPDKEVIITSGAAQALLLAFLAHCNPGDEVLVIEPSFLSYNQLAYMTDAVPVPIATSEDKDWIVDPGDIESAITDRTKMVLLNSPNNPTGAVYPKETLERIAEIATEHDLIVVSDEIYEKIIHEESSHFSIGALPGMKERTITINGFSKAYAMTGWRLGYVAASEKLTTPMLKVHQYAVTCVPTFTQYGAIEAIRGDQKHLEAMISAYNKRRDLVYKGLNGIEGITCSLPEGAFYAFLNIKQSGLNSVEFAERLLSEKGVALIPGSIFSSAGEGFLRLSFAASEEQLLSAMKRIEEFVVNINSNVNV
ncbi:pyridoxal phosphate-dependent aminotransferase [Salinicoccus hispanicus]|uniref:Aminotransferase n=1 Tax=Salinicoccus hispanicus TaxID=157225 RepID=A0A6N8TZS7_9STAP|nr:pyridoxal phosphate-dependent aminotransferase [Salinicoccus hispanicus]MXQ50982.1 aminotransferase class I/II-fold pyridoxal phosphate-dependent enzyme [Salinicoccus hispanicus]